MTKKDFELIASIFSNFLNDGSNKDYDGIYACEILARQFCDELQKINPRFDRIKFLNRVGLYDVDTKVCADDWIHSIDRT